MTTITEVHGDGVTLNLRTADALLHIGQEAIANAVTHSGLTVLKIIMTFRENYVELVIEDNGKGFEYTSESKGFGILGMQKRARGIAGTMEILSTPGQGTRVRVLVALEQYRFKRWFMPRAAKHA